MTLGPVTLVAVGTIIKPFGVTGQVVVQTMTDTPARFRRLRQIQIGADARETRSYGVQKCVIEQRGVRLKLESVDDRTSAERLVGLLLFVSEQDQIKLPKGKYFIHDVIGMRVVDEHRGDVGVVRDVLKYPAHDVYVVAQGERSFMIPAVKEIVLRFDTAEKVMSVRLVDGMIEEQEGEVA